MAKMRYDVHIETSPLEDESSLVLFRFPAMRSQFENSPDSIDLKVKPKSLKFKLDVNLDSDSLSYSKSQAQTLGAASAPKAFVHGVADKNFYTSSKAPVDDGQLFVCKTVNDRLVCRPVSCLFSLRSDFSHFDLKEETDPKEEVKPISVKFAAPDRQHSHTSNKSHDNIQESDDPLDEYRHLIYKPVSSFEATDQRAKLFGERKPVVKPDPDAEPVDVKPPVVFVPDVKGKIEKMDVDDIYSSESGAPTSPRKSNHIKQRVKECLFKAKIVSFEEVYHFLREKADESRDHVNLNNKDILDALSEQALLVQGNWAVKSEILYGDSSQRDCTDVTGISINLFTAARDYLLWLFSRERLVSRLEYSKKVKMPDHDILELFNQLAVFRKDIRKWELKLPTDLRFQEQFPDVVQRQATIWKVRRANKLSIFSN